MTTPQELDRVHAVGSPGGPQMTIMRRCRSCRADAMGLLDDDRSGDLAAAAQLKESVA